MATCSSVCLARSSLAAPRPRPSSAAHRPLPVLAAARTGGPTVVPSGSGRDFASSLALMTLGASILSERLNGHGLLQQLDLDNSPLLAVVAAGLAAATFWPSETKAQTATDKVRDLAGRASFAGLSAAVGAELWFDKGLLSLLEVETGVGIISEVEALIAAGLLLVLTQKPAITKKP